jgi:Patatin phospholipase
MTADERETPAAKKLLEWGCGTTMHVVQLKMQRVRGDDHTKDIDFSVDGLQARWDAGYAAASGVLESAPWRQAADPIEGIAVHDGGSSGRLVWSLAAGAESHEEAVAVRQREVSVAKVI